MPTINVKVDEAMKDGAWKEATKVPGRTVSDWVRGLIAKALDPKKSAK